MRKTTRYITLCLMSLLAFAGCDVHENGSFYHTMYGMKAAAARLSFGF